MLDGYYAHYENWIEGLKNCITVNFNQMLSRKITLIVNYDGIPV